MNRSNPSLRGRRSLVACLLAAVLPAAPVLAQEFPSRPIRMVTPYPPGASTDLLARLVANGMTKALGQTVVVDSRPGAGGTLAAQEVARAAPDGYTFLLVSAGIVTMNQSIYKKLPYDPIKDFSPLTVAVRMPIVTIANPSRPFRNTQELIAYAKANPGKLSYGSAGTGTSQHLAGELFKSMAGVDILHVPYKGGAPAMNDLLGGQVDLMFAQTPSALPQVRSGKLRALGVGSPKRIDELPDVPTVAESGVAGYDSDTWYGFVMPARVPPAVGQKLYAAIATALKENAAQFKKEGFDVDGAAPEEMGKVIASDSAKWAKVIKAAKIEMD
ncbi:tripartite tricarboxylate transporter substrate binding protein [Xylophilus sp. Kf1]|nr:tripartite tricarboxylate transporter substrate binding protein [Xylophilus sp. Kf1]